MNKNLIITSVIVSLLLTFGLTYFLMSISYQNSEVKLRNTIEAQQEVCELHFDKMWKIIKQQAGVTSEYKEAFSEIYPQLISGRYQGETLMKWIQESNPDFDVSLYKTLMVSIESQRESFFDSQKTLRDMKREHDNLISVIPGKWFLSNVDKIEVQLISSENTKAAYSIGEENDIELFKK